MRYLLTIFLYCGAAVASQDELCVEVESDLNLSFEEGPHFVTEENPLGPAMLYTTGKYEHCETCVNLAWYNAYLLANKHLWDQIKTTSGGSIGDSCGGDVTCQDPVRAHNVQCTVTVGDCDYMDFREMSHGGSMISYIYTRIKAQYQLECLGDRSCEYESRPIPDCCTITSEKSGVD